MRFVTGRTRCRYYRARSPCTCVYEVNVIIVSGGPERNPTRAYGPQGAQRQHGSAAVLTPSHPLRPSTGSAPDGAERGRDHQPASPTVLPLRPAQDQQPPKTTMHRVGVSERARASETDAIRSAAVRQRRYIYI